MSEAAIDPRTRPGVVTLTVRDLERAVGFYERALGLALVGGESTGAEVGEGGRRAEAAPTGRRARLGPVGGDALVELVADPDAPVRPPRTTGLFHLALLVPDRAELARSLRRIVAARVPLSGASDHLVSEALYLSDPEGNGIEIYRDRPRDEWRRDGDEIRMATLPLDLDALLGETGAAEARAGAGEARARAGEARARAGGGSGAEKPSAAGVPADARIGHVHLNVADLASADAFYGGLLGLERTVRSYPGALFMAAGGYHHHIGLNTWRGEGAPAPPPGAAGLRAFELLVPDADEVARIERRLRDADVAFERSGDALRSADPSSNGLVVRTADRAHRAHEATSP